MTTEDQLQQVFTLSGLNFPGLQELIHQAIINSWSNDELMFHVVQSPAFAAAFPGIFRPDGSLKMDPASYRAQVDTYRHTAYVLGYNPSAELIGQWIQGDVSPQEVADRYTAANRIKESPQAFAALQSEWKAAGLGNITQAGAAHALLGQAPKQFYDIWERANLRTAATLAGAPISHGEAVRIQGILPDRATESSVASSMQDLAHQLKTTMPLSRLYASHGITRSDLITLEFGGPGREDIAARAQRALDTEQASWQQQQTVAAQAVSGAVRPNYQTQSQ
jgi:hypothetical protein